MLTASRRGIVDEDLAAPRSVNGKPCSLRIDTGPWFFGERKMVNADSEVYSEVEWMLVRLCVGRY